MDNLIYIELLGVNNKTACVFIPGGYHTGKSYTETPDGRIGWAKLASNLGYKVYVTDIPGSGRSPEVDFDTVDSHFIVSEYMKLISNIKGNVILFTHSISGSFGFKLVEILGEKISKVVAVEPSMFGNIQEKVVPSLETPEKVIANFKGLDFELDMTKSSLPTQKVIDRFTTINDNSKKLFPKNKEEYIKNYINSLVPLHPKLLYELFNIGGSKLKIDDFSKLKKTKFLIISSPDDPLHKEEDPKIVEKLKSENISVEYWKDGSHGTFGNSHMMMVEKNNQDIFNEIDSWIKKN